jgi:hypothetical protein
MSHVARQKAEEQYASIRSALSNRLRHQGGWLVKQVSFIAEARLLNEQDLRTNRPFSKYRKQVSRPLGRN